MTRILSHWRPRRWWAAAAAALAVVLLVGIPTDLIDTPLFVREIPPTWWSWPALIVTAVLSGLLLATYVDQPDPDAAADRKPGRGGVLGATLSFFAVGCPVCNKLVLLALGTSGAVRYFEPLQPILAVASVALLGWALVLRVRREYSCPVRS